MHGANSKPLPLSVHTRHLRLEWGPAMGRASFVVISGLAGTLALIGLDLMMMLCMQIDVPQCTTIPRPIHTLQAKEEPSSAIKSAYVSVDSLVTQTSTTSSTSAGCCRGCRCWLNLFVPLPSPHRLSSSPTLASGPLVWIALHNLLSKPITVHAVSQVGIVDAVEVVEPNEAQASSAPMSLAGLVPDHLSLVQQHHLMQLLDQCWDILR